MSNNEILNEFYVKVSREVYIAERIIREEYRKAIKKMAEEKKMNKWHDLRKDPTDLPKDTKTVWVILSENPTEVEMDSYNPGDKGKKMVIPAYDRKTENGQIEHREQQEYEASGWWAYDVPGLVTHWTPMDVPEPPACD